MQQEDEYQACRRFLFPAGKPPGKESDLNMPKILYDAH